MKQNKQFAYVCFQINISFIKSKYNIIHVLNFDICLKSCFIQVVNYIPIPPSFSLWRSFSFISKQCAKKYKMQLIEIIIIIIIIFNIKRYIYISLKYIIFSQHVKKYPFICQVFHKTYKQRPPSPSLTLVLVSLMDI